MGGRGQSSVPRSGGYGIALVGTLAFVVACFLPYVTLRPGFSPTLYEMQTMRHTGAGWVGAVLMLFTGVVALAVISSVGIRGSQDWTAAAFFAVALVWTLDEVGFALGAAGLWPTKAVGYWVVLGAVGLVVVGAIIVAISGRGRVPDRPDASNS